MGHTRRQIGLQPVIGKEARLQQAAHGVVVVGADVLQRHVARSVQHIQTMLDAPPGNVIAIHQQIVVPKSKFCRWRSGPQEIAVGFSFGPCDRRGRCSGTVGRRGRRGRGLGSRGGLHGRSGKPGGIRIGRGGRIFKMVFVVRHCHQGQK